MLTAGHVRTYDAALEPASGDETVRTSEAARSAQSQTGTVAGTAWFRKEWQDTPFVDLHPSTLPLLTQAPSVQGQAGGR